MKVSSVLRQRIRENIRQNVSGDFVGGVYGVEGAVDAVCHIIERELEEKEQPATPAPEVLLNTCGSCRYVVEPTHPQGAWRCFGAPPPPRQGGGLADRPSVKMDDPACSLWERKLTPRSRASKPGGSLPGRI